MTCWLGILSETHCGTVVPSPQTGYVFSVHVVGLEPLTQYYYACLASNAAGAAWYALERTQLTDRADDLAGALRLLDRKRLEVARALAGKPKLLLLDEPTAGMSLEETRETMALVDRLNEQHNITILFTEHDLSVVFNHARNITLLHHGEIIIQGTPDQVRSNKTAQHIYFGEH